MKKLYYLLIAALLVLLFLQSSVTYSREVPQEIAGIRLGAQVGDYPDFETSNYLKEVVVMDWHGFRKGIVSYGVCESPGTIVKMRMKYEDGSKKFFDQLMDRFKRKYGAPDEWKGDSFGIKHIWKWTFKNSEGKRVNMILQHNAADPNESIGNVVKLSYPELDELERLCFNKMCETVTTPEEKERKRQLAETGWDYLIPQ